MIKCALVTKDKFIRYDVRDRAEPWFSVLRPLDVMVFDDKAIDPVTEIEISRIEFRLDRIYVNEHEEKVAIYYEI